MGSAGSLSAEPDVAERSPAEPDVTEGSPAPKAIKEWVFPAPYPSVKAGYGVVRFWLKPLDLTEKLLVSMLS